MLNKIINIVKEKFNMINELMKITNANLLAVGDDFQSIYRFTGCDLHIFLNFTKYFKDSKIMYGNFIQNVVDLYNSIAFLYL